MARGKASDLMIKVHQPRKPFMTNPAMMHLISEMPEPAAYGAYDLTRLAAVRANRVCDQRSATKKKKKKEKVGRRKSGETDRKNDVHYVVYGLEASPPTPVGTALIVNVSISPVRITRLPAELDQPG